MAQSKSKPLVLDPKLKGRLEEFWVSPQRSAWLKFVHGEVYVRKGHHQVFGRTRVMLDLANFEIDARYRNRGLYSQILDLAKSLPMGSGVYIENVLDEKLTMHLVHLMGNDPDRWQVVQGPSFAWIRS